MVPLKGRGGGSGNSGESLISMGVLSGSCVGAPRERPPRASSVRAIANMVWISLNNMEQWQVVGELRCNEKFAGVEKVQ